MTNRDAARDHFLPIASSVNKINWAGQPLLQQLFVYLAILGKLEMLGTYPALTFDLLRSCLLLVFSSLANGHSPWAGSGQVIYLLY